VARLRIRGTTRRQVIAHFLEIEKASLQPLDGSRSRSSARASAQSIKPGTLRSTEPFIQHRYIFSDKRFGFTGIATSFAFIMTKPRSLSILAYAPDSSHPVQVNPLWRLPRRRLSQHSCLAAVNASELWAEAAVEDRGVCALRLIQGVLGLTRQHPRERVPAAARTATVHRLFATRICSGWQNKTRPKLRRNFSFPNIQAFVP
jgi:hypothetical protein